MEMQLSVLRERKESVPMHGVLIQKSEEMASLSLGKTPDASEPSRMQDGALGVSLGEILKEQVAKMRAMHVLLESMDEKLKAVCEIAEARAISFARSDSQEGGEHLSGSLMN